MLSVDQIFLQLFEPNLNKIKFKWMCEISLITNSDRLFSVFRIRKRHRTNKCPVSKVEALHKVKTSSFTECVVLTQWLYIAKTILNSHQLNASAVLSSSYWMPTHIRKSSHFPSSTLEVDESLSCAGPEIQLAMIAKARLAIHHMYFT